MKNYANGVEIPMGFGMALAQNAEAMDRFAHLSKAEQEKWIQKTHDIRSKQEMRAFVNQLTSQSTGEIS